MAILLDILTSNIDARLPFLMGALAGFLHLTSMSTFFNPFLWVLLSIYFVYKKQRMYHTVNIPDDMAQTKSLSS